MPSRKSDFIASNRFYSDSPYRPNAILLQGPPITQIPTARVFAYATHFDAHPIGE